MNWFKTLFFPVVVTAIVTTPACRTQSGETGLADSATVANIPVLLGAPSAEGSKVYASTLNQTGYQVIESCVGTYPVCTASGPWLKARETTKPGIFELAGTIQPTTTTVMTLRALKSEGNTDSAIYQSFTFKAESQTQPDPNIGPIIGGSCSTISERIIRKQFALDSALKFGPENVYKGTANLERDWYNGAEALQIVTSVAPNSEIIVGWHEASAVRVGRFSSDLDKLIGSPLSFKATRLRDIVADQQGIAVLSLEAENGSRMALRRFENDQQKWRAPLIAKERSHTLHMGRVARYADGSYATYFGVEGGGHQGDALQFVDANGQKLNKQGSWDWGCSHSMDERLAIVGGKELPVCIGDNFPAAIALRRKAIVPEVKQYNGLGSGTLGGMVHFKDHMVVIESTKYSRSSRDIALVAFEAGGSNKSKGRIWLTDAAGSEVKPKIALYGTKLLVMWKNGSSTTEAYTMKVVDLTFTATDFQVQVIKEEGNVPFEIGFKDDLASTQAGEVVAAGRVAGATDKLQIQVLKACND